MTVLYVPRVECSLTDSSAVTFGLFVSRAEGRLLLSMFRLELLNSTNIDTSWLFVESFEV